MRRQPSIICLALSLAAIVACGDKKGVETARHSVYDADFAIVYGSALEITRGLYPSLDDTPGTGFIRTAWHQVTFANNQDDLANPQVVQNGQGGQMGGVSQGAGAAGMPTQLSHKRYFIRFEVAVLGGRPWRVKITGHASEWEPGAAMPVELHGLAKPPWLEGRTDALTLAIYDRLKKHAIRMKEEAPKADPLEALPKTDVAMFDKLPEAATKRLAHIRDSCLRREFGALRADLAEDVVFAVGGDGNADTALAMWQADPDTLDQMAKTINPGCGLDGDTKITCPKGVVRLGTYQLVLELRGTEWKLASFVKAE